MTGYDLREIYKNDPEGLERAKETVRMIRGWNSVLPDMIKYFNGGKNKPHYRTKRTRKEK